MDPDLEKYINDLVDRKITQKMMAINPSIEEMQEQLEKIKSMMPADRTTILVFSCDYDRLTTAFTLAVGAAAMEMDVCMYFTFWGLAAIKKTNWLKGKTLPEKLVSIFLPRGAARFRTSRYNFFGIGPAFFRWMMKTHNVQTLPGLIETAMTAGVRLVACEMCMGVLGITENELLDGVEIGGATSFLGDAIDSRAVFLI